VPARGTRRKALIRSVCPRRGMIRSLLRGLLFTHSLTHSLSLKLPPSLLLDPPCFEG
jgi:hypothetical protein